ncbi:MAG: hypothetical protein NPIRA05_06270 [Nitrospirales bacterium]|nr:MAG: hypothetical protein NPIRA05_06270 [Nitrospirales bacterium]
MVSENKNLPDQLEDAHLKNTRPGLVFISYKREEAPCAALLREALVKEGFNVWWDEDLQCGQKWADKIDEAVREAACIIVLWSDRARDSEWVRHEASQAIACDVYAPCRIELVQLFSPYDRIQATDLIDWDGDVEHSGFRNLLARIETLIPKPVSRSRRIGRWIRANVAILVASGIAVLAIGLLWTIFVALQADRREKVYDCSVSRELRVQLVQEMYSNGQNLDRVCLHRADLREIDLSGANLQEADFRQANLRGANLAWAKLTGADLTNAMLRGANLFQTDFRKADLTNAELTGADLTETALGTYLATSSDESQSPNLTGANLREANLRKANLHMTNLTRANLTEAHLAGANFMDANLTNADLHRADLRGADLRWSTVDGMNFDEANFAGVNLSAVNLNSVALIKSVLKEACADKMPMGWPKEYPRLPPCSKREKEQGHDRVCGRDPASISAKRCIKKLLSKEKEDKRFREMMKALKN